MRLFSTAAVLAAGALISACATLDGEGAAPPAAAFDTARLSEHVRVLADDSFQGRGIATPAEEMTVRYLSEQYAAAGFQPGGPNGAWTQDVTLNRFSASNFRGLQLRAGGETIPLTQGQQITISTRLPG
ncbi:MAG: peptidase M20, partial [Brevundimonas sp.]